jgi:hypothetical protein
MAQNLSLDYLFWASLCLAPVISSAVAVAMLLLARRKQGGSFGVWDVFALTAFVITFLLICLSPFAFKSFVDKTNQAIAGAHATLDQLPHVDGVELAAVRDSSFFSEEGGRYCSFGRLWILFGTSLPAPEAFDRYVQELQSSGWRREGRDYEKSRGFGRDAHAYLNISYNDAPNEPWDWGKHPDYLTARNSYSSILFVSIDYVIPSRRECWH